MDFQLPKGDYTTPVLLRKIGYAVYVNRQGKESYVRRIRGAEFPRFHLYVNNETDTMLTCSVHLDQRAPVYRGAAHAHGGDYDSPEVVEEVRRLQTETGSYNPLVD